jgi:hypothetical protein
MTPIPTTFKSFYEQLDEVERQALADKAGTSTDYLYQLANGYRRAGASILFRLQGADERITAGMLRPDLVRDSAA